MKGWVQVDVINKEYVPVIDIKSGKFKDNKAEIKFAVQKQQHGPIQYEMKPAVGMLIDKYLPPSFLEVVVKHLNDYAAQRNILQPDLHMWEENKLSRPFDMASILHF
eukprot:7902180-Ditylum_brightwellii.AAC.1